MRVKGGGHTSQVYAIRQAIAKAVVAYYAKYVDAFSAMELKKKLVAYDRSLLIADPRRAEPKKFGGHGARARRQKRCVVKAPYLRTYAECSSPTVTGEHAFHRSLSALLCCFPVFYYFSVIFMSWHMQSYEGKQHECKLNSTRVCAFLLLVQLYAVDGLLSTEEPGE